MKIRLALLSAVILMGMASPAFADSLVNSKGKVVGQEVANRQSGAKAGQAVSHRRRATRSRSKSRYSELDRTVHQAARPQ